MNRDTQDLDSFINKMRGMKFSSDSSNIDLPESSRVESSDSDGSSSESDGFVTVIKSSSKRKPALRKKQEPVSVPTSTTVLEPVECKHKDTIIEEQTVFCSHCGIEIEKDTSKMSYSGGRSLQRRDQTKNLYNDVKDMNFPDEIKNKANAIFVEFITESDSSTSICRGDKRKALIFACIKHAYAQRGEIRTFKDLNGYFQVSQKTFSKVNSTLSKTLNLIRKSPVNWMTPDIYIKDIMKNFTDKEEMISEVVGIYERVREKIAEGSQSYDINRSRPSSVASGIVYYWIRNNPAVREEISLTTLSEKINISANTISKKAKEIALVLGTDLVLL